MDFIGLQEIDSIVGRPWGAVILKSFKTAPKIQPKSRKNCEKSSWNCKNHQNSFQKPAQKLEKLREKVAEITINPKTAQKYEDYGIMVGFNYFTKKSPHISVQAPFEI